MHERWVFTNWDRTSHFGVRASDRALAAVSMLLILVPFVHLMPRAFDDEWRYAHSMNVLAVDQMSWDEKLRAMEELWASISVEESRLESPTWHEEALRETVARYEAGQEQPIDWADAKRQLRKRAE